MLGWAALDVDLEFIIFQFALLALAIERKMQIAKEKWASEGKEIESAAEELGLLARIDARGEPAVA